MNINERLRVNGTNAVDKSSVSPWSSRIAGFENDQAEFQRRVSLQPITVTSDVLLESNDKLIRSDGRIRKRKPATQLSVYEGSVNIFADETG